VALADFDAYLGKSSDFPEFKQAAYIGKGFCQAGLGNYVDAANLMIEACEILDEDDPRYLDAAFHAGELFATAGDRQMAAQYYQLVADKASGTLRDRAAIALEMYAR